MPIFHLGMKLFNKKRLGFTLISYKGCVYLPRSCTGLWRATLFTKYNQLGCNTNDALANTRKTSPCEHADSKWVLDLAIIYLSFNISHIVI